MPVFLRFAGGISRCLGDAPAAEAESFDDAESVEALEFDRERLNLIDSTSSESMSERSELGTSWSSMVGSESHKRNDSSSDAFTVERMCSTTVQ